MKYTETRTVRWNGREAPAEIEYSRKGNQLIVRARVDGWGGSTFQEFDTLPETAEALMELAKEYSMDGEAIADADIHAGKWDYEAPF